MIHANALSRQVLPLAIVVVALPAVAGAQSAPLATVEPAAPSETAVGTDKVASSPFDGLKIKGDVRLRLDLDRRNTPGDGDNARTRPRLRARLGISYETPLDGVSLGIRLATNAGAPGNSPHQTFGANFGTGGREDENVFALDRAFLKYETHGAYVIAGKHGWPHWGQTEILWDIDIQPEGLLLGYSHDFGQFGSAAAQLGYYYLGNNHWRENFFKNDAFTTWQASYKLEIWKLTPTFAVTGVHIRDAAGGSTNSDGNILFRHTDFIMASVQVKSKDLYKDLAVDFVVGFDLVKSTAQPSMMAQDHTIGFVIQGRAKWRKFGARYYYYNIQEASVPFWGTTVLSQDNFPNSCCGGLTGFSGHRIQADVSIGKGVSADFRIYLQRGFSDNVLTFAEVPDREITRYQLNVNAKF